jgi:hypothetical protein
VSFSIVKAGAREDVKVKVGEHNVYGDELGEHAKNFILLALECSQAETVIVEANGHTDKTAGGTSVSINVRPAF